MAHPPERESRRNTWEVCLSKDVLSVERHEGRKEKEEEDGEGEKKARQRLLIKIRPAGGPLPGAEEFFIFKLFIFEKLRCDPPFKPR